MKKGVKLLLAGAAVAVAAMAIKKYQDSYELIVEEETVSDEQVEEDDFVPVEEMEDDFDYILEDADQIIFHE